MLCLIAGQFDPTICQSTCVLQIYPEAARGHAADCAACTSIERQIGFAQFDAVHSVVVATITRDSFLPNAMRLKWLPSNSKAQWTADLSQV